MNRFYQKSTNDFYTFILLTILSITTLALDHKYKQIDQIRSFISDLIVYPITMISSLPKSIIDDAIRESTNLDALEQEISRLKKDIHYDDVKKKGMGKYKSDAQRKAVHASKAEQGPGKMKKDKQKISKLQDDVLAGSAKYSCGKK